MGSYEDSIAAFRAGETALAEELALELLSRARDDGDVGDHIDALCMLARVALRRGDLEHVGALAGEGRDLARRAGEPRLERMPIHMQAVALRMQGEYMEARVLYRESIELNTQLGEERMVALEHRNLAYVELHDHHLDRARQLFHDAVRKAHALGLDSLEPFFMLDAAVMALADGDRKRAAELAAAFRAAIAQTGQIPDPDDAFEEESLEAELFRTGPPS
jgi:tetratricopeptide (TPR) repeat protein